MSEKTYAQLPLLFPSCSREPHRDEGLQLFRDRDR